MEVDILIKSFNRPYYLERCIRSIYQFITGEYRIKILDDGTPKEYLERLSTLFPEIEILLSPTHNSKSNAINDHIKQESKYDHFSIPSDFWVEEVRKSSDIFLLMEDDIWLTAPVDVSVVAEMMQKNHFVIAKLSWHGNENLVLGEKRKINNDLEQVFPPISYLSKLAMMNKFYLGSIYHRLGRMDYKFKLPFYNYYTVASAFFNRKYWLYLWEAAPAKVNEFYQLKRATKWSLASKSRYAKTIREVTKTSFITSATNSYKDVDLDIFRFNHHLNEAWLSGSLDPMNNFPNDFEIDYIKKFLDTAQDEKCTSAEWQKWINKFKGPYKKIGCNVD